MAYKVTLDLTPSPDLRGPSADIGDALGLGREGFRLHRGAEEAQEHWLLRHPYGRDVLITKLREVRPDLQFSRFRTPVELEPSLDAMVDLLQLRDWPRPRTVTERIKVGLFLIRVELAQALMRDLAYWRSLFSVAES